MKKTVVNTGERYGRLTEDYCNFDIAKLLKEKGFRCDTLHYYYDKDGDLLFSVWGVDAGKNEFVAPTLQMAMKWLREVHNKSIEVRSQGLKSTGLGWVTEIYDLKNQDEEYHNQFTQPSYEKACEAAIKYCLENLIYP